MSSEIWCAGSSGEERGEGQKFRTGFKRTFAQTSSLAMLTVCLMGGTNLTSAYAQTGIVTPETAQGVQIFERAHFNVYNPVTAEDLVNRVPGFSIDDGDNRRGFGATAGNVLINGERPSSKTPITEQLQRIAADSIVRVELISGSVANVDVRGQSQLVNLVLSATASEDSKTTWVAEARHIQFSDKIGWTLQATRGFKLSETADLTVNVGTPNLRGRREMAIDVYDASGDLTATKKQFGHPNNIGLQGSARLAWKPSDRDTVNANIEFNPTWDSLVNGATTFNTAGDVTSGFYGRGEKENKFDLEAGADWERQLTDDLSVKVLGLVTQSNEDVFDRFNIIVPGVSESIRTQDGANTSGERVVRGVANWNVSESHTLEFGAEGAFNFRDTELAIALNGVPQTLSGSTTRVEELRGEAFITDIWRASDTLTLETGFTFEASRITQTGDAEKEREFTYPKPRISATYQAGPGNQFIASYERDVSQLRFNDFASSVAVIDDIVTLGNAELEPEKTWQARLEWDRRFGDTGALNIALIHDRVEDKLDLLPVTVESCATGGTVIACAPADIERSYLDTVGNIGDGTRIGVDVNGTLALDALGIPNGELRVGLELRETEVTDPLTGEKRRFRFAEDWEYDIDFRQEVPSAKIAWGFGFDQESDTAEYKHLEFSTVEREGTHFEVFLETTRISGITLRFNVRNITSPSEIRTRYFYDGPRGTGALTGSEVRDERGGPYGTRVYGIRASGTF